MRFNPNNAEANINRRDTYKSLPDYQEPINAIIYNELGNACEASHNYLEAIENYNQALRCNPNLAIAYHNRGVAYQE